MEVALPINADPSLRMPPSDTTTIYRILDASGNRVGEGLRTLEDWVRFGENNARLTQQLKAIRHDVASALSVIPRSRLLAARDTPGDVGGSLETSDEYTRTSSVDVILAAVARTGQSLRVIEEYVKTIDSLAGRKVEQARYRFYTVAAEIEKVAHRRDRRTLLKAARLYALVDCQTSEAEFCQHIELLVSSGVEMIQLRDAKQTDRTLVARAKRGCEIANQQGALLLINDRADLAYAADCDGVHLGQDEIPVPIAREIVGNDRLVGCSTHSIDQAIAAVADGADYLGCGPVFPSSTKSFELFPGLSYLDEVARQIQLPCFAIGGIDHSNAVQVVETGIHRIAVSAVISDAEDPANAIARLKSLLLTKAKDNKADHSR